jgi:hypothetical protein
VNPTASGANFSPVRVLGLGVAGNDGFRKHRLSLGVNPAEFEHKSDTIDG